MNGAQYLVFATIGFELVGLMIGSFYLGSYLDQKFQGGGLYFVGCAFGALIFWLVQVVLMLRKFQKEENAAEAGTSAEKPKSPL